MRGKGAVRAVIFDWAGTIVDFGSLAPVAAFGAAFKEAGVDVSTDEIRKPMGLEKRLHITKMLGDESIADRWRDKHGAAATERDIDRLYSTFNRCLIDVLPRFAQPIPGVLDTLAKLREGGVKIGSNTGYSSSEMAVLSRAAREHGLVLDCVVSSSDVARGRPAPDMSHKCLELLGVDAHDIAVKVDDTSPGIEEGRNAGLWTVAVTVSGNEVGLSQEAWSALSAGEQEGLRAAARERIRASRPDYVIDTVAELGEVIEMIEARAAAGERPAAS